MRGNIILRARERSLGRFRAVLERARASARARARARVWERSREVTSAGGCVHLCLGRRHEKVVDEEEEEEEEKEEEEEGKKQLGEFGARRRLENWVAKDFMP